MRVSGNYSPREGFFYGWVVVAACLVILTIIFGMRSSFGVFFKSLEAEFFLSRAVTSAVFSTHMIIAAAFGVLAGWALDRYGPRIVLLLMGAFTGTSLVLTSQTYASWQLFITYGVLLALGSGAGYTVLMATVSRWFHKKRGLAVGIASSGTGLGTLALAPFAAYLISGMGWRMAYLILGLIAGLVIISLSLLLKKEPGDIGLLPDGAKSDPQENHPPDRKSGTGPPALSLSQAARTRSFWALATIWLLYSACLHLVLTHVVPYAMDTGIAAARAATVLGLMGGSNILGRLIMGTISDRTGRKTSAVTCALLACGAMVWLTWSRDLWTFYLFSLVFGFCWGGISATTTALMADTYGLHNLGVIMAVMNVGFSTGAAIGPLIGGYIFDVSHSYLIAFLVGALFLIVTAISAAITRKEL